MSGVPTHGGNLRLANHTHGRRDWLDFSANVNPLGLPDAITLALLQAITDGALEHYPDPDSLALREAFARTHGLFAAEVLPGNGASEALHLALAVLPRGEVALPSPCFGEYGDVARLHGHTVCPLAMDPEEFALPRPARRYAGVILGNPNNPTSRLPQWDCLLQWLDACDWAIVDEAFVELTVGGEDNSIVPLLRSYPNLIILRALTKVLALPGLRLGYALAAQPWIAAMKAMQVPWSVNALAQAVAGALPDLRGYLRQTEQWIAGEPFWLYGRLRSLGLRVWSPDTNFILCRSALPAAQIVGQMAHRGILIRDASNFAGLDGRYFRLAVRQRAENERLLAALEEVLA